MATIVRERHRIRELVKAKQRNEQAMLFRLNNLFKNPISTRKLRNLILIALRQMLDEQQSAHAIGGLPGWGHAHRAMMAENNLAVWSTLAQPTHVLDLRLQRMIEKLQQGSAAVRPVNCNDISELIRVVGAWLEMGGGHGAANINKAYRTGVERIPKSAEHGTGLAIKQQQELDEQAWGKHLRQRESPNQHHQIEEHVADWWVSPKHGKESGMQLFRANRNDLCRRIDLLFGLLVGATLSGTTTDTVLVLEAYGAQQRLHPGYYLFPVATIAASLHHTALEAGLALTLAGVIDSYCVGFYTTLKPKGGFPGELEDAEGILLEAEEHPDNRHMVLWYDSNPEQPVGCILFERRFEIEAYRRLVEGKGLLTHVMTVPQVPRLDDVARLIDLMAPKLLAYLPDEFQPRRFRSHA